MPNPNGLPYVAQGWTDGAPPAISGTNLTKFDSALVSLSLGLVGFSTQTGNYTLVLADSGTVIEMNSATGLSLTIPPNSSVAFAVGTTVEIFQYGAGQVTIVAGAGVTLRSPSGRVVTATQYASVMLRKRAADEWCLEGDLA